MEIRNGYSSAIPDRPASPAQAPMQAQMPGGGQQNGQVSVGGNAGEPGKQSFQDVWSRIQGQSGQPEKPRQAKKQLDKDDFMRMMITQMQHQDPTKPFEADKMAQEIAQITSFEALSGVSKALDKLSVQNRPLERLAMTSLIGKEVTVDRSRFTHDAGKPSSLSFQLPENAAEVKISLISDKGEVVLQKDLGPKDKGENTFNWDGKKENTLDAENGIYLLKVDAKGNRGQTMQVGGEGKVRVMGVSFQGKEPVFIVGDAQHQTKIPLDSVVEIAETGGGGGGIAAPFMGGAPQTAQPQVQQQQMGAPQAQQAPAQASSQAPSRPGNFFTFQKGVGSMPMGSPNSAQLAALNEYQARRDAAAQQQAADAAPAKPEGFPNGMAVYNEKTSEGGEKE